MPGHLRNFSYARTAHALLTKMCAGTTPIPEVLTPDHHIVSYLSEMTNNTLNKMVFVLTNFTLEQMNMLQPMTPSIDSNVRLQIECWHTQHRTGHIILFNIIQCCLHLLASLFFTRIILPDIT